MRQLNQFHNVLIYIFCKNSSFVFFVFVVLCRLEFSNSQNLNVYYHPEDQNIDISSEHQNLLSNATSHNSNFWEEGTKGQLDSAMGEMKENKIDLAIPRDYNYFLYDAEPYLPGIDTRVRRTPFVRKKTSRPIHHQRIYKSRPFITTEKKTFNDNNDEELVDDRKACGDEEEEEDDEERDEDNDDYDDQGRDCETTERCKLRDPCESKPLCETTEECSEPPTDIATEEPCQEK